MRSRPARLSVLGVGAALVTGLAGCASSAPTTTTATAAIVGQICCVTVQAGAPTVVNGIDTAYNGWDTAFISWLVPHDAVAGQMAALAATNTTNQQLLTIADQIDSEQSARYIKLSALATAWGQPVPSTDPNAATGHDHGGGTSEAGNADALRPLNGAAFDRRFLTIMIDHHQAAIPEAQATVANGVNPQDIALARVVLAQQQAEITQMQQLQATLG